MRILLAVDDTPQSEAAVYGLLSRSLPDDTRIEVLTVVHSNINPTIPIPALALSAAYADDIRMKRREAPSLTDRVADRIRRTAAPAEVTTKVLEGEPDEQIVREAADWRADLIVLGSHERGPIGKAVMGSTAEKVAEKATCQVEIIATPDPPKSL